MNTKEFIEKYRDNLTADQRERQWAEHAAMLTKDAEPLVAALTAAGWPEGVRQCGDTRSEWDLVNTAVPYPHLLSTLAEHLTRPYHKRTKEGIARALAVKEARGTHIPRVLMEELKKETAPNEDRNSYRWALINSLVTVGDSSLLEEVRTLLDDPRYEAVRIDLQRLAKAIQRPGRAKRAK